jgi:hypothetical protein
LNLLNHSKERFRGKEKEEQCFGDLIEILTSDKKFDDAFAVIEKFSGLYDKILALGASDGKTAAERKQLLDIVRHCFEGRIADLLHRIRIRRGDVGSEANVAKLEDLQARIKDSALGKACASDEFKFGDELVGVEELFARRLKIIKKDFDANRSGKPDDKEEECVVPRGGAAR